LYFLTLLGFSRHSQKSVPLARSSGKMGNLTSREKNANMLVNKKAEPYLFYLFKFKTLNY